MVDVGWSKVELLMEEEEEAKDVGGVGICIGSLISLSVGDSIVVLYVEGSRGSDLLRVGHYQLQVAH